MQIVESGGNQIVVIEVPRADRHDKPVYTGVDPFSGTYRRNGEGDYRCTKDEVRAMMRDQADVSQDARVMDTMTIDCLDIDTIRRYRQRIKMLTRLNISLSQKGKRYIYRQLKLTSSIRSRENLENIVISFLTIFSFQRISTGISDSFRLRQK